jgi:crossover junction endodeoxyribonuclease RuvC
MRSTSFRTSQLSQRAIQMRHAPTTSEARLFELVRGGQLGVVFRRQVPVLGRYIVDLVAPQISLVVEIDGGYHAERARADARRDRALARAGYHVVRIEAELIMRDEEAALALVRAAISERT